MFTVDGLSWSIPCDIERTAEVTSSDISGMLMDGSYFNDVLGTYMKYTVTVCPNPHQMGDYYSLFRLLSEPVDGHTFVLPYDDDTIQITGRVEDISDIYVRMPNNGVYWKGASFTVISNAPTRTVTLQQAIQRGLTPIPDVVSPEIGDTYTYTANGWEETSALPDADTTAY